MTLSHPGVILWPFIWFCILICSLLQGRSKIAGGVPSTLKVFKNSKKSTLCLCISKTVVLNLINAETFSTVSSVLVIISVKIIPLILFNFNQFIIILHNCNFGDRGLSTESWPTGSKNCYNLSIHIWFCKILPILGSRTIIGSHESVA